MDMLLHFFSDLILFTAGLAVALFWIVIFILVIDELIDLVFGRDQDTSEEDL